MSDCVWRSASAERGGGRRRRSRRRIGRNVQRRQRAGKRWCSGQRRRIAERQRIDRRARMGCVARLQRRRGQCCVGPAGAAPMLDTVLQAVGLCAYLRQGQEGQQRLLLPAWCGHHGDEYKRVVRWLRCLQCSRYAAGSAESRSRRMPESDRAECSRPPAGLRPCPRLDLTSSSFACVALEHTLSLRSGQASANMCMCMYISGVCR
jgi:hypothetical protein